MNLRTRSALTESICRILTASIISGIRWCYFVLCLYAHRFLFIKRRGTARYTREKRRNGVNNYVFAVDWTLVATIKNLAKKLRSPSKANISLNEYENNPHCHLVGHQKLVHVIENIHTHAAASNIETSPCILTAIVCVCACVHYVTDTHSFSIMPSRLCSTQYNH